MHLLKWGVKFVKEADYNPDEGRISKKVPAAYDRNTFDYLDD